MAEEAADSRLVNALECPRWALFKANPGTHGPLGGPGLQPCGPSAGM